MGPALAFGHLSPDVVCTLPRVVWLGPLEAQSSA